MTLKPWRRSVVECIFLLERVAVRQPDLWEGCWKQIFELETEVLASVILTAVAKVLVNPCTSSITELDQGFFRHILSYVGIGGPPTVRWNCNGLLFSAKVDLQRCSPLPEPSLARNDYTSLVQKWTTIQVPEIECGHAILSRVHILCQRNVMNADPLVIGLVGIVFNNIGGPNTSINKKLTQEQFLMFICTLYHCKMLFT